MSLLHTPPPMDRKSSSTETVVSGYAQPLVLDGSEKEVIEKERLNFENCSSNSEQTSSEVILGFQAELADLRRQLKLQNTPMPALVVKAPLDPG